MRVACCCLIYSMASLAVAQADIELSGDAQTATQESAIQEGAAQEDTAQENIMQESTIAEISALEITYLLKQVEQSGCVFFRNGKKYHSSKAADHMRRKYNYGLRKHDHITAEQFIEYIATKSSWTGKTYSLQCQEKPAEPSAQWLAQKLGAYRAAEK